MNKIQISDELLKNLRSFRHELHAFPELSGQEVKTSMRIRDFLLQAAPDEIITNLGGYGLAAVFDSGNPGPCVLFRADMDALPIEEANEFDYKSKHKGVAHLCGHDGHSTILAGLAFLLKEFPSDKGKVVLLFQPAEEVGTGAAAMLKEPKLLELKPDYCFALHNLPGFDIGQIVVKAGPFAAASTGMIIQLKGKPSHAAHPEDGNNPDKALARIIQEVNNLNLSKQSDIEDFFLVTVIHARLGEVAFGTTPGNAVVMLTLRAFQNADMERLRDKLEFLARQVGEDFNLKIDISYHEPFPATENHPENVQIIKESAFGAGLQVFELDEPFRWSEDFGHFSQLAPSALFGVGSGSNFPQLHNENYDFPNQIITPSLLLLFNIVERVNKTSKD